MNRFAPLLLLVYLALAGAGALCPAGVVVHDCPLDGGETCSHETDCPGDPCQVLQRQATVDHGMDDLPRYAAVTPLPLPLTEDIGVRVPAGTAEVSVEALAPPAPPLLC